MVICARQTPSWPSGLQAAVRGPLIKLSGPVVSPVPRLGGKLGVAWSNTQTRCWRPSRSWRRPVASLPAWKSTRSTGESRGMLVLTCGQKRFFFFFNTFFYNLRLLCIFSIVLFLGDETMFIEVVCFWLSLRGKLLTVHTFFYIISLYMRVRRVLLFDLFTKAMNFKEDRGIERSVGMDISMAIVVSTFVLLYE